MLGVSFVTKLKSNLCKAPTKLSTTGNNCISSYAQNTAAPRDLNRYRPELFHMHRTQLHLGIWTRIVLNYRTCTEHNCTSGFEHVLSWIISHAQNTTAPRDLNTYRPELQHMHRTQLYLRIWTRVVFIISHAQNTTAPRDLNTYRPELSHVHRTQLHIRIWARVVFIISHAQNTTAPQDLNTCRPELSHMHRTQLHHNHASVFEHVSSCRLPSNCTELHRFSVMGYKINLTVENIRTHKVLLIHKATNLALDKARWHSYKLLPI